MWMIEIGGEGADHRRHDVEQQYARPYAAEECEHAEQHEEEQRSPSVTQQDECAGEQHNPWLCTDDWRGGSGEGDTDRDVLAAGQCFGALARGS